MNFDESLQYLLSLGHETLAIKLGLDNTERLLEALGNPQTSFPSVQIAGTNGKGSTAVMLEAMAHAAGIKTGLYTSPHLLSITERIRIDNQEISPEDFARLTTRWRKLCASVGFIFHAQLSSRDSQAQNTPDALSSGASVKP
jgi:dihydrofolate synthase/folylpolyglutamate synthase